MKEKEIPWRVVVTLLAVLVVIVGLMITLSLKHKAIAKMIVEFCKPRVRVFVTPLVQEQEAFLNLIEEEESDEYRIEFVSSPDSADIKMYYIQQFPENYAEADFRENAKFARVMISHPEIRLDTLSTHALRNVAYLAAAEYVATYDVLVMVSFPGQGRRETFKSENSIMPFLDLTARQLIALEGGSLTFKEAFVRNTRRNVIREIFWYYEDEGE